MSIRDRVAMHVAVGEMIYSPKLNEAYMAFANGRRASSRFEKAMWLANHADFRKIKEYITFKLVWICSNCGKPQPAGPWTCECGTQNTGKFCSNCGKPQP